jgi:hypothetical protein
MDSEVLSPFPAGAPVAQRRHHLSITELRQMAPKVTAKMDGPPKLVRNGRY